MADGYHILFMSSLTMFRTCNQSTVKNMDRMYDTAAECTTQLQNVRHICRMYGTSAECTAQLQNVRHICIMYGTAAHQAWVYTEYSLCVRLSLVPGISVCEIFYHSHLSHNTSATEIFHVRCGLTNQSLYRNLVDTTQLNLGPFLITWVLGL